MIRGGLVTLNVSDVGRSVRFYVETLGMKLVGELDDGSSVIDAGEGFLVRLRAGEAPEIIRNHPVTFFPKVPLAEAVAIYENRGVTFTQEPSPSGIVARFRDPDANLLVLETRE